MAQGRKSAAHETLTSGVLNRYRVEKDSPPLLFYYMDERWSGGAPTPGAQLGAAQWERTAPGAPTGAPDEDPEVAASGAPPAGGSGKGPQGRGKGTGPGAGKGGKTKEEADQIRRPKKKREEERRRI